jgi:hypothetical protein
MQAHPGRVAFDTVRSRRGRGGEAERAIYVADSRSHVSFGLTRPHASGATRDGRQIQGLVDVPPAATGPEVPPHALLELRREALDPAVERDVVDLDATFCEEFLEVAVGEPEAQVPPHRDQDHVGRKAEPGEGGGRHRA